MNSIKSDFFNTPWFKTLYMYGYFSSELTKFSYKVNTIQTLPLEGVELLATAGRIIVVKKGTGIPCFCTDEISGQLFLIPYPYFFTIPAGTAEVLTPPGTIDYDQSWINQPEVQFGDPATLKYYPKEVGTTVRFKDGDYVDFSLVIDQNIKQIDLLGSIAKKFNLVFVPDPDVPKQIIIEPFDYYMGTGNIYDWTPKLSFDKGFTVEPALNFIESSLLLTDLEDQDEGNRIFKNQNNRIYGQNNIYNPTDFKSQEKKIDTIFSPQLIRKWDSNIGLPLGINYSATNEQSSYDNQVRWLYKGVKTKPKLMFWLGGFNPFIDKASEVYVRGLGYYDTYSVKIDQSNNTGVTTSNSFNVIPTISHTMPMGVIDRNKINNDSLCILFNSELPTDSIGVQSFSTYTENDIYNKFYSNRISNLYDPNTRLLVGNFDLNYADIQNLSPNDIIKINEQYFIVNKISEFNLTNRELTKVELLQFANSPQTYPDRYFSYYYCDDPSICYKFKTDFTNPNLRDTNFAWSVYYDYNVGLLWGDSDIGRFTSTMYNFNTGSFRVEYIPYTMEEITETEYISGSCYDWSCDTMKTTLYSDPAKLLGVFRPFWESSGHTGTNAFESCYDFYSGATTYGIVTGSSTTYGVNTCLATPTPTPTVTVTPTPGGPTITPTPTPTITPTPTSTPTGGIYTIELRMNGMVDRNGSFTLYQSPDGSSWTESVVLNTVGSEVAIQSFNGTPGYYYYYVVTKTSGALAVANVYNAVLPSDFSPGPIEGAYCGFDTVTFPSFQLPTPTQSKSYISFNGTLDSGCL